MSSQITLKNLENQEFSIVHPDGKGARSINSNEILSEIATAAEIRTGTDNTKVITPLGYHATTFGWGQTWQNVLASRSVNVTYTNTTGKPIMVNITPNGNSAVCNLTVDGVIVADMFRSVDYEATISAIVPNGSTYLYTHDVNPVRWAELR